MRKLSKAFTLSSSLKEVQYSFNELVLYRHLILSIQLVSFLSVLYIHFMFSDATTYAHFLFQAFDMDRSGSIRFEVSAPLTEYLWKKPKREVIIIIRLVVFTGLCDRTVCVAKRLCHRETSMGVQPVRHQQRWLRYKRGNFNKQENKTKCVAGSSFLSVSLVSCRK